jgi:hypothetical protein
MQKGDGGEREREKKRERERERGGERGGEREREGWEDAGDEESTVKRRSGRNLG